MIEGLARTDALRPRWGDISPDWLLAGLYATAVGGFAVAAILPSLVGLDPGVATMPYRALVVTMSGAIIVRWLFVPRRVCIGRYALWVALAWLLLLSRMLYDFNVQPMPLALQPGEYFMLAIGTCLLPAIATLESPTSATLRLGWQLATAGVTGAAVGLAVLLWRDGLGGVWLGRLSTEVLNPISVGHLGASLCLLTLAAPAPRASIGWPGRSLRALVRLLLFALGLVIVIAAASRGPMLSMLVGALAFNVVRADRRYVRGMLLRGLPLLAVVLMVGAGSALLIQEATDLRPVDRVTGIIDESNAERRRLAGTAMQQFAERPLTGDAMVDRQKRDYPHNVLLEGGMALGIVGLIVVAAIVGSALSAAVRILGSRREAAWLALIAIQYVVAAFFSGSLFLSDSFWVLSVAAVAVATPRKSTTVLTAAEPGRTAGQAGA